MSRSITQSFFQHRSRHAPPRPAPTVRAGSRRSPGGRSAPPCASRCRATTVCATRSATVGTPSILVPAAMRLRYLHRLHRRREVRCPTTSDSRSCTDCSSDRSRTPRCDCPSTPGAPLFALTFSQASQTSHFEISNGLPGDFSSPIELLPDTARLIERTSHGRPGPFAPPPITGASPLLRAGPPARPASVLSPSRCLPLGALPLARPAAGGQYRDTPSPRSARKPQTGLTSPPCRTPPGQ